MGRHCGPPTIESNCTDRQAELGGHQSVGGALTMAVCVCVCVLFLISLFKNIILKNLMIYFIFKGSHNGHTKFGTVSGSVPTPMQIVSSFCAVV